MRDPITGLMTGPAFDEFAVHYVERAKRYGDTLWMLQWALDDERKLRRTLDQNRMDSVLKDVAVRAIACTRSSDVLARLDEHVFALILLQANEYVATVVGDRLRRSVHRISARRDTPLPISISCGGSPCAEAERLRTWRNRVNRAMKKAAAEGGDRVLILHPTRRKSSIRRSP